MSVGDFDSQKLMIYCKSGFAKIGQSWLLGSVRIKCGRLFYDDFYVLLLSELSVVASWMWIALIGRNRGREEETRNDDQSSIRLKL